MAPKKIDLHTLDKRLVDRTFERGAISRADFEKYLASLEDKADNAEDISDLVYADEEDDASKGAPAVEPVAGSIGAGAQASATMSGQGQPGQLPS